MLKDLKKAVKQLKKCGGKPARLYMSESEAERILNEAHAMGLNTKSEDGYDYIFGARVITHPAVNDNTCYIGDYKE